MTERCGSNDDGSSEQTLADDGLQVWMKNIQALYNVILLANLDDYSGR